MYIAACKEVDKLSHSKDFNIKLIQNKFKIETSCREMVGEISSQMIEIQNVLKERLSIEKQVMQKRVLRIRIKWMRF